MRGGALGIPEIKRGAGGDKVSLADFQTVRAVIDEGFGYAQEIGRAGLFNRAGNGLVKPSGIGQSAARLTMGILGKADQGADTGGDDCRGEFQGKAVLGHVGHPCIAARR